MYFGRMKCAPKVKLRKVKLTASPTATSSKVKSTKAGADILLYLTMRYRCPVRDVKSYSPEV
jgi:hypothetical protein